MLTVPEISLAVLVYSGVGFGVLWAIPSAGAIGMPLEERLLRALKEQKRLKLSKHPLLEWRSVIIHSISNPAVLWFFGSLYLVACTLLLIYLCFPESVWDTVAKVGVACSMATTISVAGWTIVLPVAEYSRMRWAANIFLKRR
jgi:hypothetical protein